jgi:predicted TIM-barrel fold metal-dependent hydrolase
MIIDIHVHCFPDGLAPKVIPVLEQESGFTAYTDGSIKDLKRTMSDAGIDISVIQPVATKPNQTISINRWAISMQQDTGILSFGTIHPDFTDWKKEIKFLVDAGIKGIKFHPNHQDFFLDDPKNFPIYEEIFKSGLIILFHLGIDLWNTDGEKSAPLRLKNVLKAVPGGIVIAAHMGGYAYWDDVEEHLVGMKNVYLDTAYAFRKVGNIFLEGKRLMRMIKQHGVDKILFATDSPWTDSVEEVSDIKSLELSEEDIQKILGKNAQRLLNL